MITQAAIRGASLVEVDAAIAAALEAYDGDAAGTLMLAAGLRGRRFPSSLVRRLVQRLEAYEAFLPLIAVVGATGSLGTDPATTNRGVRDASTERDDRRERARFLVALGEDNSLPKPVEAGALLGAALLLVESSWAALAPERGDDDKSLSHRLRALVRIRSRDANAVERSYLALAARTLGDPVGEAMINADPLHIADLARRVPQNLLAMLRGKSLGLIRETDAAPPVIPTAAPRGSSVARRRVEKVARPGEKVGRNDPCMCGSGRKAKKCCAGATAAPASAVPMPAPSPRTSAPPPRLVPTHPSQLTSIPLPELSRLNPASLPPDVATSLLWTFNARHLWDLSERVLDGLDAQAAKRSAATEQERDGVKQRHAEALSRKLEKHPELVDSPEGILEAAKAIALDLQRSSAPPVGPNVAELRLMTAKQALLVGAVEEAQRFARGTNPTDGFLLDLEFLRGDANGVPLASAERVARRALSDVDGAGEDDVHGRICDLAFTLLRRSPALGILVARGALDTKYTQYTGALVELVERARARLGLDPHDKALDHLRALTEARDGALLKAAAAARDTRVLGELEAARRELGAAREKAKGLQAELRKLEKATAAIESKAPARGAMSARAGAAPSVEALTAAGADPEEAKRLRAKVQEMKGLIREAQAERRAMRTQLAELQAAMEEADEDDAPESEPDADDDGALDDGAEAPVAPRGWLVPEFSRDAQKDLRDLPSRVARAALQAVADVGTGEWKHVKQMYSSGEPLFTVRIGIHYRALFRAEEGMLRVLRVVAREELMEVLRRVA